MAEARRPFSLVGMKETEGERIVGAIQKLADKIHKLETERQLSKRKVESLSPQEISGARASDLFQRLAKAEARCKALQQQLAHIRKIVRETTFTRFEGSSMQKSSLSSDVSTTFGSLPSLSVLGQDATSQDALETDNEAVRDQQALHDRFPVVNQNSNRKSQENAFSQSILEIPIHRHLTQSVSSAIEKSVVNKDERPAVNIGRSSKLSARNKDFLKEYGSKFDGTSSTCPSTNSSILLLPAAPDSLGHASKKQCKRMSQVRSSHEMTSSHFSNSSRRRSNVISHYHVKMNEIPFCSATTAGKSHSLSANLQNLMSMVKVCHPALCTAAPLHKRRSRSAERRSPYNTTDSQRRKMTRWSSASALDSSDRRQRTRHGSCSVEVTVPKYASSVHSDLDLVPVKLKATGENSAPKDGKGRCETAGNVCIKTEIKPSPVGSNKVVEVKMTTSAKPKCDRSHRTDLVAKRRELLKDVQELQHLVETDQCC